MSRRYRQVRTVPARTVGDLTAVIVPSTARIHRLNDSGSILWKACLDAEGATVDDLVSALVEAVDSDVTAEAMRTDVEAFLDQAVAKGLMEVVDTP